MTVSQRGTPLMAKTTGSASPSVTGTWNSTQVPVAGDRLVAVVAVFGSTTAALGAAPAGWVQDLTVTANSTQQVAFYSKVAAGGDAAPAFTSATTGTASHSGIFCELYDLTDSSGRTPALDTSGTATGTTGTVAPVTSGNVTGAGEFAIAGIGYGASSSVAQSFTTPGGWSAAPNDAATAFCHAASFYLAGPSSGGTLTASMVHGTSTSVAGTIAVYLPPYPQLSSLQDPFNQASVNGALWGTFTGGSATLSFAYAGGTVNYPASSTSSTDASVFSQASYSLAYSSCYAQILATPSAATSADGILSVGPNSNNLLRWVVEGGTLFAQYFVAGATTTVTSFAYSAVTHRWWRIREAGGTCFWDTSANGINWTNRASHADPIDITNVGPTLEGSCFENETSPGSFSWNNFNYTVAPFFQATSPAGARFPQRPLPRGRVASGPGAPVRNPVPPLYSVVQHASNTASFTSGASNSATVTFGQNITPGNTVVLFIGANLGTASVSTSSVTTNGSADNWSVPDFTGFFDNIGLSAFAWDPGSAGGTAVVDFSFTQSAAATTSETTSILLDAFEVAGLGPNPGIDAYITGSDGGASTTTWGSGSTPGDPAGANNGIFLGSVCLFINAANTTSTVTGPGGWTNEALLSGSIQQGGTGTANKFFVYQLSGYEGPYNSSPPALFYSGTNSAAADAGAAWAISLWNGIIPSAWDQPIAAVLPHPPAGPGNVRGRVGSNKGAPVSNPVAPSTGPVFYPARQAIRAKLPQQPLGTGAFRGRTYSSPPQPVRNPTPGPVFIQKSKPVRFTLPPWQPRAGRIGSSFGAPVQNPIHGPPVYAPLGPVRARLPQLQPRAGRAGFNPGAPARNPSQGPVFRQAISPARIRPALPPRGRIASAPAAPPAISPAVTPAPLHPQGLVRARIPQVFSKGRVSSNAGAPVRNPSAGPAFTQAVRPARIRVPQVFSRGRIQSGPGAPAKNPTAGPPVRALRQPVRAPVPKTFSKGRARSNPGTSAAVTYYVSPSGSDSNNGLSPATAWQTVAKVNGTTLIPGDTVLFQGGQTFSGTMLQPGQAGTAGSPITFGSYGTGQATITNSSDSAIYVYEVGGVTVENLIITGPGAATAGAGGYVGVFFNRDLAGYAAPVAVTGCTITGWADGILAGAADAAGGYSGITFTGNQISANRDAGINVYGSGYSHQNVVITGNSAFNQTGDSGNTTTSSGHGIVVGNASGGTISQNVTYGNGASCGCTTAGPVGNWAYSSQNLVIEYNVSYGNLTSSPGNADGDGFDLDDQCVNCTLQYNIAYENDGFGIACYSDDSTWTGNVIRYNVTWQNSVTNPDAAEIAFTGGAFANCDVYGNTFIGQTNAELPSVVLLYGASFTSVNLWNNIFYTAASGVALMYTDTAYTGVTFQGNLYYSAAPFSISWGGTSYSSLAAWRTGTSQEILSGHNTGRQANPQFNAPGTAPAVTSPSNLAPAYGLQLAPHSPAAAQGLNLAALFSVSPGSQDFFGNTLAYPLWIGAYQGLLAPQAGTPVRARLPQQPLLRGRVHSSPGGPVQNPAPPVTTGPPFYPAVQAIRARLPRQPSLRGRIASNPGPHPRNPVAGPLFRQATSPARIRPSLPPRGRITSNPGAPVVNPVIGQGPAFFPLRSPARARIPQDAPRGRVSSNRGAPASNPVQGPAFRQFRSPVRIHPSLPPRGRAASNAGAPVSNPPPPTPGAPFTGLRQAVRARYLNQVYVLGNPGLIYVDSRDGTP